MTTRNFQTTRFQNQGAARKRILLGAGLAFILITAFLLSIREPNPEWPQLWMVKPLLIVPLAGAMGGVFTLFLDPVRKQGGWKQVAVILLSGLGYLIALWLGTVLGLNGALWN